MADAKEPEKISRGKDYSGMGSKLPNEKSQPQREVILNGLEATPHYLHLHVNSTNIGVSGAGNWNRYRFQENIYPVPLARTWPHVHLCNEYFIFFGIDPDKLDDIGGTCEFWLGVGEDAEPYIINKPTIINVPPLTYHLPQMFRGFHGLCCGGEVHDGALRSFGKEIEKLHPSFKPNKLADPKQFSKKYQKLIYERDISMAAHYPAHEGKAHVLLYHDQWLDDLTTHVFEITLVTGAGIGWGCGDLMEYSKPKYFQQRSVPHVHDVLEVYYFCGTDPDNPDDLGATVEFWIGEGAEAKKYTITKHTYLCVPPNTVHLPMWVSEVRRPFILFSSLDSGIWTGSYIYNFPPTFEHLSEPTIPQMKLNFKYDQSKCTYPKCHLCMDVCPVTAIDLSVEPRVIGKGCRVCGACEFYCPTGAMGIDGLVEA